MNGSQRRQAILSMLGSEPISGSELSRHFGVSRQVIVQDMALLRATDQNIIATGKGYILFSAMQQNSRCRRCIPVRHTNAQIMEEFEAVLSRGGSILDVIVEHEVYGQISASLFIRTRSDAEEFIEKIRGSSSLMSLTDGTHFHTVEASDEATLDRIEHALKNL